MVDGMRIAVRTAAIAGLIIAAAAIYGLFAKVQVPAANVSQLVQVVGMGKGLINHWAPEVMWLFTIQGVAGVWVWLACRGGCEGRGLPMMGVPTQPI